MGLADPMDPAELTAELYAAWFRQQLEEMVAIRMNEGPFRAGWESAIEEIAVRFGGPGLQTELQLLMGGAR